MSDDLFDNVEIVSLDTVTSSYQCNYCNSTVTFNASGDLFSPDCTGECGGDDAYLGDNTTDELDFS